MVGYGLFCFFQAEDGIRDLVRSRGLGDVYKRQALLDPLRFGDPSVPRNKYIIGGVISGIADYGNCVGVPTVAGDVYFAEHYNGCLLYTSDAAAIYPV